MKKILFMLTWMVNWQTCFKSGECYWSTTSGVFDELYYVNEFVGKLLVNPTIKIVKIEVVPDIFPK